MLRSIAVVCAFSAFAFADDDLPEPPYPVDYVSWLRELPQDQQLKVAHYCSVHGTEYQYVCGGIGPLHIPRPPGPCARIMVAPAGSPATRPEWRKSLTTAQRHYVDQKCRLGRNQDSQLCHDDTRRRCSTPLVVSFDDAPVVFAPGARFAFTRGAPTATDWPTSHTPWIALDRDGDGEITAADELFGSATLLPDGTTAPDGFTALSALDANHDGVIDRADPAFGKLVLWSDDNRDGRGSPDELAPLARSIVSISLAARADSRCDGRGNCEGPRAQLTWRDGTGTHTGTVVDVYLPAR